MERTWTALWKMPPRPMRSLKMRLIWRMVLFVFSESLFVTSYTWSTTSCIAAPPPASRYSSSPVAEAAVRFGLGRRERGSKRRRVGWVLVGRSLAVVVVVLPNTGRIL
jgi:hypothetical protein